MMDYFDIIKASSGIPVNDPWAMLWAQSISEEDWQLTTLTGTLPLTFQSKGTPLTDYKLYGTSEGAGVETESGEPTGYKLPMTVTSGEQSQSTPIYIGDTKLGAEEYVDYASGKVYKIINIFNKDTAERYELGKMSTFDSVSYYQGGVMFFIEAVQNADYTLKVENDTPSSLLRLYRSDNPLQHLTTTYTTIPYTEVKNAISGENTVSINSGNSRYIWLQFSSNWWQQQSSTATILLYTGALSPTDPPVPLPELSTYDGENVISFDDGVVRTADSNPEHPQLQADLSLPTKQNNVLYSFREFANVTDSTASQREVYVITKSILPKLDYINIHFWENGSIVKTLKTTRWYTGQNIDGMRPMFPPEGYCFIIVTLNKVPINRFPFKSTIEMVYKEAGNGKADKTS